MIYFKGEISRIEKEYYVLQEQLKEACENYEQVKLRSSEETRDLEDKLRRNTEESTVILSETLLRCPWRN
jgi:E3 ubiquitin-protein ligase TTC3